MLKEARERERSAFDREMELLTREVSEASALRAYTLFVQVLRWLRLQGHGELRFSAIDHMVGTKIRLDTVVTLGAFARIDGQK